MAKRGKLAEQAPNGISQLCKELFQAAIILRGAIEPADYKRYVLPIIFLRFLSLRYERRRHELETLIADPKSDYHTTNKKQIERILNDPDEYRSAGAFIVPEAARWSSIVMQAQKDTFRTDLDELLTLLEDTYPKQLRGLLPKIYAGSNMDVEHLRSLINLFSKDVFREDHGGTDLVGRVYEYFIGEFASSEGKRGGEFFTPLSIVKTLVAMLEPTEGKVYDPCCGSGGMFVQSDAFTKHTGKLSFFGQESKDFTYRLCRMNMFIHGINGAIELGNTYTNDGHASLRADYVIANPPFNDGAKGDSGWGADKIPDKDPRLNVTGKSLPLSPRNANTMWMMHFLYHLAEGGTAGFVMATGELSNGETARTEVRKSLVENDLVDCIVQLPAKLFANTPIPSSLWFLSKGRKGGKGGRKRTGEILFIDARKMGALIPGSRKQKQLADEEIEKIATIYRQFRRKVQPDSVPGFARVVSRDEVCQRRYALTAGGYVGSVDLDEDEELFEDKLPRLIAVLREQIKETHNLDRRITQILNELSEGVAING